MYLTLFVEIGDGNSNDITFSIRYTPVHKNITCQRKTCFGAKHAHNTS